MAEAAGIVSVLLAGLVAFAALRKLSHRPQVVEAYARVGVPEDRLDGLAYVLLAGAAGLGGGVLWGPLGLTAAAGLTIYFVLAIAAHIRANDTSGLSVPVVLLLLAATALALRLAAL